MTRSPRGSFPVSAGSHGLKLNGNDDKLRRADFRSFAATAGLKAADTDATMDKLAEQMGQAIGNTGLPELAGYSPDGERMAEQMFEIIRSRLAAFARWTARSPRLMTRRSAGWRRSPRMWRIWWDFFTSNQVECEHSL
jgi:hypothetical protein